MEYVPFSDDAASASDSADVKSQIARMNSVASSTASGLNDDHVPGNWQEDADKCSLCHRGIGALRRHHCRICGRCVCAACSPSQVQLEGYTELERACTPCICNAQSAPEMLSTTVRLATRLNLTCG